MYEVIVSSQTYDENNENGEADRMELEQSMVVYQNEADIQPQTPGQVRVTVRVENGERSAYALAFRPCGKHHFREIATPDWVGPFYEQNIMLSMGESP